LVLPVNSYVRILVTAADVLHSWAVPSLGVKVDACIGRLNETSVFILREGVFFGQCSEICGVGHANMPIVVEAVGLSDYISWLSDKV
jgi:heme/copper-type cytochrome/quinol oxidase subunit 2